MPLLVPTSTNKEFEQCPPDTHVARLYQLIDLGTQKIDWQGQEKWQRKVLFRWELPEALMSDGRPFTIGAKFTLSFNEKGKLLPLINSWRGKALTADEIGTFDLEKMVGAPCLLSVAEGTDKKDGKKFSYVSGAFKLPKGTICPKAVNEPLFFTVDMGPQSAAFQRISEKLQQTIKLCREWNEPADIPSHEDEVADAIAHEQQMKGEDVPF